MKKHIIILVLLIFSNEIMGKELEKATLGGGCFWCTEAVYLQLKGVVDVKPGYSGGHVKNPTYNEVCTGNTGHAEVVQVTFDPEIVSFSEILEVFFVTHDPTTLNRQGNDVGTQYRSAIFYHSEKQKQTATEIIKALEKEKAYKNPIVTEVTAFDTFYVAEDYHINYFARNKNQPYCQYVVAPKVEKFQKVFKDKMKVK
jgi:peptide-methionine (S)-S-oxide reductase